MSHSGTLFKVTNPIGEGLGWVFKCGVICVLLAAGTYVRLMKEVALLAVVGFVLVRGFWPFIVMMTELNSDRRKSAEEAHALTQISTDRIERIHEIPADDAGSVGKMLNAVVRTRGVMTAREATDAFLSKWQTHYEEQTAALDDASNQSPTVGLLGTLYGLVGGFSVMAKGNGDSAVLYEALSTMSLTTLVGCVGFLLLSGLASIAVSQVAKSKSDLEVVANQLVNVFDGSDSSSPEADKDVFDF